MSQSHPKASEAYLKAIELIDEANGADPNIERSPQGDVPRELLYSRRMMHWLAKLEPEASEALRLAARAQHIERWKSPRAKYPEGRKGYLRWRTDLYEFHAQTAGRVLGWAGVPERTVQRTQSLLRKRNLATDPEMQTLEDVACLVFLESYFGPFAAKHDEDKLVTIVQKTWKKMSPRARQAAMGLKLTPENRELIEEAIGS